MGSWCHMWAAQLGLACPPLDLVFYLQKQSLFYLSYINKAEYSVTCFPNGLVCYCVALCMKIKSALIIHITLNVSYFKAFQVKDFSETPPLNQVTGTGMWGHYLLKLLNRSGYVGPIYLRKSHNWQFF